MITILVVDEAGDNAFVNALAEMLDRHFVTVRTNSQKLKTSGKSPDLLICDAQSFGEIETDQVIVVYKAQGAISTQIVSAASAVAIVDSSSDALLAHVSKTRLPAITCGLNSRDTISLSSMTAPGAVIDLRRSITCLDESQIEPQEIPMRLSSPVDSFLLMSLAAILILTGKVDHLKEGFI
ncbi:MAG: hypothetical protein FWE32_07050 [Oscillospiraceae bacterium]|nr:hypothetical protein [Oscillospiraceae bacterium]